jgi:hypothetical protein
MKLGNSQCRSRHYVLLHMNVRRQWWQITSPAAFSAQAETAASFLQQQHIKSALHALYTSAVLAQ